MAVRSVRGLSLSSAFSERLLHLLLAGKNWSGDHSFDRRVRSLLSGVRVVCIDHRIYGFLKRSPTGILSRALIYGPGIALFGPILEAVRDLFTAAPGAVIVCPIGMTYGLVGTVSPVRADNVKNCHYEGDCPVCLVRVPSTYQGRAQ